MIKNQLVIRQACPDDIPFIYNSWLKSLKFGSDLGKFIRTGVFYENYRVVIDQILASTDTNITIAALKEDPTVIIGYLIGTDDTAHYCFVKESFRRFGVANFLIEESEINPLFDYTHLTYALKPLKEKLSVNSYNPFSLYKGVK